MRRGLAIVLLVLAGLPASAGAQQPPPDWVLVRATVGAAGAADVELRVDAHAGSGGSLPIAFGHGIGSSADGGSVAVHPHGNGPLGVSLTRSAGWFELNVDESPHDHGFDVAGEWTFPGPHAPGARLGALLFTAGTSFDQPTVHPAAGVTIEVVTGRGSQAIPAAHYNDYGAAGSVGPVALGLGARQIQTSAAIVGALSVADLCGYCRGGWSGPPGYDGEWQYAMIDPTGTLTAGDFVFGGPAGFWAWTWQGLGLQRGDHMPSQYPVYGAWAPIGADWPMFVPH